MSDQTGHQASQISAGDVGRWIRRHGWVVVLCTIVGAAIASAYAGNKRADLYRASAILAIVPPAYTSELLPSTLTVQGYQELLESDAVLAATAARLRQRGALAEGHSLGGGQTRSRIFVSERREETLLAPMIRLEARASTADGATAIANTWAEVFLERVQDLMFGTTAATVRFIEAQYPKARDRLSALEQERLEIANDLDRRHAEAENRWQRTLAAARTDTARQVNDYEADTNALLSTYRTENRIAGRRTEIESLAGLLSEYQRERVQVDARLSAAEHALKQLEKRLAETEPVLVLKRSLDHELVVEEALARKREGHRSHSSGIEALEDLQLSYETQNPLFRDLSLRTADRQTEVAVLRPRGGELERLIERQGDRRQALARELTLDEAELNRRRAQRESGLAALFEKRTATEDAMENRRDAELTALERERETLLLGLDRRIDQERALFEELAEKYNEALLAKAQEGSETIRLAAPAVPPSSPLPRGGRSRGILLGLLLGAFVGLGLSMVRAIVSPAGAA